MTPYQRSYESWVVKSEWRFLLDKIIKDGNSWEVLFKPSDTLYDFLEGIGQYQKVVDKNPGQLRIVIPRLKSSKIKDSHLLRYAKFLSMRIFFRNILNDGKLYKSFYNIMPSKDTHLGDRAIVRVDDSRKPWRNDQNFSFEIRAGMKNTSFRKKMLLNIIEDARTQDYIKFSNYPPIILSLNKFERLQKSISKIKNPKGEPLNWQNLPITWDFKNKSWINYLGKENAKKLEQSSEEIIQKLSSKSISDLDLKNLISNWVKDNLEIIETLTEPKNVTNKLNSLPLSFSNKICNFFLSK